MFIWQQVQDCLAGVVERPTAVRAESAARHGETVSVGGSFCIVTFYVFNLFYFNLKCFFTLHL